MRALTRWMSASPPSPRPHVGLATVLADEGKIDEALTEVNEALRLAPNNIDARQRLAAIYLQQGNWQGAGGGRKERMSMSASVWLFRRPVMPPVVFPSSRKPLSKTPIMPLLTPVSA